MRVNVYAEEMTDRVEIISKEIDGRKYTGLRIYLELPCNLPDGRGGRVTQSVRGPFLHRDGDDDSSAVTFWGKQDLRVVLRKALALLDEHYEGFTRDAVAQSNELRSLAQVAYEAAMLVNSSMPPWDSIPHRVKNSWIVALSRAFEVAAERASADDTQGGTT